MFQTKDNSQLLRRVLWISAELTIVWSLKHQNNPTYIYFQRVRVLHLDRLKEGTWLHSFEWISLIISYVDSIRQREPVVWTADHGLTQLSRKIPHHTIAVLSRICPKITRQPFFLQYTCGGFKTVCAILCRIHVGCQCANVKILIFVEHFQMSTSVG